MNSFNNWASIANYFVDFSGILFGLKLTWNRVFILYGSGSIRVKVHPRTEKVKSLRGNSHADIITDWSGLIRKGPLVYLVETKRFPFGLTGPVKWLFNYSWGYTDHLLHVNDWRSSGSQRTRHPGDGTGLVSGHPGDSAGLVLGQHQQHCWSSARPASLTMVQKKKTLADQKCAKLEIIPILLLF